LSQEAEVGVKWNVDRVAFERRTFECLWAAQLWTDGVDRLAGGSLLLDDIEEGNEFLIAMALHVAADHRAVGDVQRGEQRRRAV
jgi:hypothetical protein